jgi:putative sterol carrier protein
VATQEEILDALADYQERCNANPQLRKMLRSWSRRVHFVSLDSGDAFTVDIDSGQITSHHAGAVGEPDLVISAVSEDLCDMLWGDINPAQKYLSGEISVQGSADDLMRVDAMASLMWNEA